MKNETARREIESLDYYLQNHTDDYSEESHTAMMMAVKALEQEPCEDAISRQAVQDYIAKYLSQYLYNDVREAVEVIDEYIGELPSVNPQSKTGHWIPVSERLPDDRDWYLGIFRESDTGWINPLPFVCDYVGHETKATTKEHWILRGFTDRDEHIDYYFNLECVAWMPLPKPYEESEE